MPRKPNRGHVDDALRRRTELAVKLAHQWMDAMNASQRGLATRLNVDQSVLSRFLSQQPGYEPTPARPRIMKLLEDIEQHCQHLENVEAWLDEGSFSSADDLRIHFRAHAARLRQLGRHSDPGYVFARLPELCAQARLFPGLYLKHACINTLLEISVASFSLHRHGSCSPDLLKHTAARVLLLERSAHEAFEGSDEETEEDQARTLNYAGISQAYIGLALADASLAEDGIRKAVESTLRETQPVSGVWLNALQLLEHLFAVRHGSAEHWSGVALAAAQSNPCEALRLALVERTVERVRAHWATLAPQFVTSICGRAQ